MSVCVDRDAVEWLRRHGGEWQALMPCWSVQNSSHDYWGQRVEVDEDGDWWIWHLMPSPLETLL